MTEVCNFCADAIKELQQNIEFASDDDRIAVLSEALLAWGKLFGCGDDRLTCYPLIILNNELEDGE